ncbi:MULTISPECIES: glycosyltransferase [unclassified Microbacterium]|uniref:glycosyltransferase n=1 Tax=unclassified Microbacterium TaxID=2609290 RepID=UPI001D7250DA|nr:MULTISPECIES: glycosyltransferase [unclassified Microbacterium]CAH0136642.1 Poly(glycerol-phosphate) alpha-glucosyltransferase [Microbacterium sp. Bi121]HWK77318.1 glycosyltransferase [Microbacterium sp.]
MRSSILSPRFRPGKQFALTWSIPEPFGGMTGALMHRSRSFALLADRPVDILTLDDRVDYPELEQRLRARGELIDGIRIINIWDWLRDREDSGEDAGGAETAPRHIHDPIPVDADSVEHRHGDVVLLREVRAADGGALAADRFRRDGTLLVTDRRDPQTRKRSVVLYDRRGRPVRSWGSAWGLYRHWLDELVGDDESFLIVDSKTAARFARTYRRRNVVTMHVLHGSHRTADGSGLSSSRRSVLENLGDFDSVALLTRAQRADLISDLGPHENVAVIPNGFNDVMSGGPAAHRRGRGLMLASLTARKRVSHAVKAVARASREADVTLDVFGEGVRRPLLEKTIRSQRMQQRVSLRGHDDAARSAFATADFMLLTSKAEGLPLALVEGMAAGCVPIAYDIPYGPADVIAHGSNGFLVPPGDVDGLAQRIVELQRMPRHRVETMRRRARATAAQFSDRAVVRAWAREMERAYERKHAASSPQSTIRRLRRAIGRAKRRIIRLSGRYERSDA